MVNTVVGLLDNRAEAEKAVRDLVSAGFTRDHIHVTASDVEYERELGTRPPAGESSGFRGFMERLGLWESRRRDIGLPAEDIGYYSEGVRRGGLLVSVETDEGHIDRAAEILEDHGAVNVEEKAAEWQRSGWSAPTASTTATTAGRAGEEARIPVVEEQLKVGKRAVRRGGVRVYTHVEEQPVSEAVTLREEHVEVERHPVDRPVSGADIQAFKEGTLELTETAEEAVASKEARVVEEVVVSKGVTEREETVRDTVRRTDVEVEELGAENVRQTSDFDRYDSDFHQHYSTHFGSLGGSYDQYTPAYRYGYMLGTDPAYAGQDWTAVEANARRQWEQRHTGTWDRTKDAIRYAWERARGRR
jgi:uncharacterized protein (TIGR02271 family)